MEEKMRQGKSTNMVMEAIDFVSIALIFPTKNPTPIMRKRGSSTSIKIMMAVAGMAFKGLEKKE
jgi:hypothetical protein